MLAANKSYNYNLHTKFGISLTLNGYIMSTYMRLNSQWIP